MISDGEWEKLVTQIQNEAENIVCEAYFDDGIEAPFLIEATDADGHIIATDINEPGDWEVNGDLELPEMNPNRGAFSQYPVILTLKTDGGFLKKTIVIPWGVESGNACLQNQSKLIH